MTGVLHLSREGTIPYLVHGTHSLLVAVQSMYWQERELLWKFRYSLTKEKRALTKLLKCVDWADAREVRQAQQLVQQWALVDIQDLLELLGKAFVGAAPWVREYVVDALRNRATDAQLLSYLLPLVQAVQYERTLPMPPAECPLAELLIKRALASVEIANFLHWCVPTTCPARHLSTTPSSSGALA